VLIRTAALLVLLLATALLAAGEEIDLVQEFLDAQDVEARAKLRSAIAQAALDPARVAERLAAGRTYAADVDQGWLERVNACADGVERPYLLFVPEDYDPAKRYRLVVDMHGGVSRPKLLTHAELEQMKFFWGEHAKEHGYLLALPTGQTGAEWWTETGAENVLSLIGDLKREFNVDENRVFGTGFSDGGSGSYYLALTHPTPFAGFIPLNGHPAVAGAKGLQIHPRNFVNKPMYAINTENDSLYPSTSVKPIMDALLQIGAPIVWKNIPKFTHNPMYLPEERPAIWTWAQETVRDPHPKQVVWEGTKDAPSRVHWLSVERVAELDGETTFEDVNPLLPTSRMRIGVSLDMQFAGPGLKVTAVVEGSPAEQAGIQTGDVITVFDGTEITDFRVLRGLLAKKKPEDAFKVNALRGDETHELEGRFPKAEPSPAFRRTQPFGSIEAAYAANRFEVRSHNVGAFDLFLSPAMVDLEKPVTVTVNGKEVHAALVKPDLGFLMDMATKDDDRSMLYLAKIPVVLAEPAKEIVNEAAAAKGPPVENRMRPDHAPTPFSAAEIREGCPAGRVSIFRVESPTGGESLLAFRFQGGDEESSKLEIVTTDLEGEELSPPRAGGSKWTELQAHASYPADGTTITTEMLTTPAGTFECWLYTVSRGELTTKAWFAKDLPGPPVQSITTKGETEQVRMTLIEQKMP
jgi:hypothetical protein